MKKFTKLGLSKELTVVLQQFGFTEPSEIQEKVIPIALTGKDIIGGSATGSGKTLAFASPIIENLKPNQGVQALILTPTRELAEQVATSIRKFGKNKYLNVLAVYGGVKIESQIKKLKTTDVLVGTPGRTLDHLQRGTLKLNNVKILVLDEVDRMFDMGFQRDVERIIKDCPRKRQTMLFSATISSDIDHLARKHTKDAVRISVKSHVDPKKLVQVYYEVRPSLKFSLLVHLLREESANLVMVFCNTRRNVDFIAKHLRNLRIRALAIHGGLPQNKRIRTLEDFHSKGRGVLVCTDVAARGLDIKGVSHVYNYDLPSESNDYIHRIGRTARAGEEGKAISILSQRDWGNFDNVLRDPSIKLTKLELPKVEVVKIKVVSGGRGRFGGGSKRRDFGRGRGGRRDDRKDSGLRRKEGRRGERDGPRGSHKKSFHKKSSSGRRSNFGKSKFIASRSKRRRT